MAKISVEEREEKGDRNGGGKTGFKESLCCLFVDDEDGV